MADKKDNFTYKVTRGKTSEVSVKVTVAQEHMLAAQEKTFNKLKDTVKISGFRPGKAPKAEIAKKLGPKLLNETLNNLLPEVATEIVEKEDFNPVTQVNYDFEDFAESGDIVFSFNFVNYPEIKLGDVSKIKVEASEVKVEKKEIDDVIHRLFHENGHEHEEGEDFKVTDVMAKSLNLEGVQTKKDLEAQVKERIESIKQHDVDREYEGKVLDEAVKLAKVEIPAVLLDQQAESMMKDHLAQIEKLGVEVDEFLQAQGLDREKLKEQKHKEAEHRIKAELLLNEIAVQNKILPGADDVEEELKSISDPEVRNSYDNPSGRRHILSVLVQQRGMQKLLETVTNAKKPKAKKLPKSK